MKLLATLLLVLIMLIGMLIFNVSNQSLVREKISSLMSVYSTEDSNPNEVSDQDFRRGNSNAR
jgi:hypothetical protein